MSSLVLDTETGGLLTGRHSLLSLAVITIDDGYNEIDRFMSYVKLPEYIVTPEALALNRIDLRKAVAWPEPQVFKESLLDFLGMPRSILDGVKNERGRWQIFGKNPSYDVGILKAFLGEDVFASIFQHRTRDITEMYLNLSEGIRLLPPLRRRKLQDIVAALGIDHDPAALHDAMYDADMTLKCMQKMHGAFLYTRKIVAAHRARESARKGAGSPA